MKGLLLFGVVFLLSLPVLGDPGNCFYFRTSVQIQQKVINGYFQVFSSEEPEYLYKSDSNPSIQDFTNFVKENTNGDDSLQLFNDILLVRFPNDSVFQGFSLPVLFNKRYGIAWADIIGISYNSVNRCSIGMSIISSLSLADKYWLLKPALRWETMPETEACYYGILYYAPKDKAIQELLKQLSIAIKESTDYVTILKLLKRRKVLVGLVCSD